MVHTINQKWQTEVLLFCCVASLPDTTVCFSERAVAGVEPGHAAVRPPCQPPVGLPVQQTAAQTEVNITFYPFYQCFFVLQ